MEPSSPMSDTRRELTIDSLQVSPSSSGTAKAASSWRLPFFFTKREHLGILSAAIGAAALVAGLRALLSVVLGRIFEIVSQFGQGAIAGHKALADVSTWCLVLVGLGIGSWMANSSFISLWIVFGELQARDARKHVFRGLLLKPVEWFASLRDGVEGLHIRTHTQTRDFQLATGQVLGFILCDLITSCVSFGIAVYYSWKLALVLLTTLPVSFVILCAVMHKVDTEVGLQKQYLQKASTLAAAAVKGIDLVTVFAGHDREVTKYASALSLASRHFLCQVRCNSIQMGYIAFWSISIFILGFWYGLVLVKQGLPAGNVVTTFHSILTAFQGIEALSSHWLALSKGKGAAYFLTSLTSSEQIFQSPTAEDHETKIGELNGEIRLEKVNFAYESNPGQKCLTEASLYFPAKKMTFLIGDSGSGKSTICALIANLLTPVEGKVLIDGYPLRQLPESYLRRQVALVHQNSPVIQDTFFNNIALGHTCPSEVTASDVLRACRFAQLESTILSLHCGVSTGLTSDSHLLSGGQKQKLALARAWLRDPTVLLMDEPTSALDPTSQTRIMEAVRKWRQDKTTVIVTHDLSNIEDEDFVYILKNGTVSRQGQMRDLRAEAAALCNPDGKRLSNYPGLRHSLVSNPSVIQPTGYPLLQDYRDHNPTASPQNARPLSLSTRPESLFGFNKRLSQIKVRKSATRPISLGWQLTSNWEETQEQFSNYLDRQFRTLTKDTELLTQDLNFGTRYEQQSRTEKEVTENQTAEDVESTYTKNESLCYGTPARHRSAERFCGSMNGRVESLLGIISTVWPSIGNGDRVALLLAIILCLIAAAATSAFSYCLARLLSAMWAKPGQEDGTRWALYLVGVAVVNGFCTGGGNYLFESVAQTWIDNLRKHAFRNVLKQPRSWFHTTRITSACINQSFDRNAQEMRTIMGKIVPIAITVLAVIFVSVIWAMVICWRLTLVALSPVPLIIIAVKAYSIVSSVWEQRCNDAATKCSSILKEALLNFEFVRTFTLESYFTVKQASAADEALHTGIRKSLQTGPLFGLYQSIVMPLTALVFYFGTSIATKDSAINVNEVLQVINLLLFSIGTTFELLYDLPELAVARGAAEDFLTYVRLPEPTQSLHSPNQPSSPLPVQICNLDFAPDQSSPNIINGLSLDINPGQSLAIVGASGSGKSTILSLLLGINRPNQLSQNQTNVDESGLRIGNMLQANIDMERLRSTMAYVPQNPFLFPATIAENITYGINSVCPESLQEAMVQAAEAAGLHDFIVSLPNAYDTVVGDGGQTLSGGQTQLVNIARALARKPQLLLLDEPTSALDTHSAATVRSAITTLIQSSHEKVQNMTLVVATHCVKMMQAVDEIAVLEAGTKVEQGSYTSLMANRGSLWRLINDGAG
ncbi:hypothetical protein ED733_006993 [Metarhizium rileyi]|uniref:ABC a-pheromone efflux pump AtrD n=1 Tax=Metarhizium rileyi (strain RCEF 4871) TaxID=1649241 RepID=A0A5C6GJJ6_METRR|nr:hypothetical protein ED733_006993 [Metarhizium rileyi]